MKIGVGARPMAMAGAFTAVADDANALFWNPAGLALNQQFNANATIMSMFQSVSYTSAGLISPIGRQLGIGAAAGYLNAVDIRRSETGEEIGTFGLNDLVAGPGIGWRLSHNLGTGVAVKYVASRIDSFQACALSFDGGLLYRPFVFLTIGASLLHLGPPRKFISDWEYPPANLRNGIALKIPISESHILVASDLSIYPDFNPTISTGAELYLKRNQAGTSGNRTTEQGIYLRCGYRTGFHLGTWSGWSLGIGYEYNLTPGLFLGVDIVYLSYGLLGDSERASAYVKFIPGRKNHRSYRPKREAR